MTSDNSGPDMWQMLREYRDHAKDLEGTLRADRAVADERHRQQQMATVEIRADVSAMRAELGTIGDSMASLGDGQRSILQTMQAADQTRIDTAAALEAADKQRRQMENGPWVTPNRVIVLALGIMGIIGYVTRLG